MCRVPRPERGRIEAMDVPSGDHTGLSSEAGSNVNRVRRPCAPESRCPCSLPVRAQRQRGLHPVIRLDSRTHPGRRGRLIGSLGRRTMCETIRDAAPPRYTSVPVFETENCPKSAGPNESTPSAIAAGSPLSSVVPGSKGWAITALSRMKTRCPSPPPAARGIVRLSVAGQDARRTLLGGLGIESSRCRRPSCSDRPILVGRENDDRLAGIEASCGYSRLLSSVVAGIAMPPDAENRSSGPPFIPTTMTPSRFHAAPAMNLGKSASVCGGPP